MRASSLIALVFVSVVTLKPATVNAQWTYELDENYLYELVEDYSDEPEISPLDDILDWISENQMNIDCYDYKYEPPRYILGLCSNESEGPYRTQYPYAPAPFDAPQGWEWKYEICETCPPGWGDWYLNPLGDPWPRESESTPEEPCPSGKHA